VIAYTNASSGSIEQYLDGDYYDSVYARPDSQLPGQTSYSVQINNTTGRTIHYDFTNPIDTGMAAGDLVEFRQVTGIGGAPTLRYTSKVLDSVHADNADDATWASDADHANWADYANAGSWPTTFDHPDLDELDASDDHPHYWANTDWRNPDDGNYSTSGNVTAAIFYVYSTSQSWSADVLAVDVTSTIDLYADDDITLNSAADIMLSSVNYYNCTSGEILTQSVTNNTVQSTTGWVTINGAAGVSVLSTNSVSVTATDDFTVDAGNVVDIHATNSLTISAQALRAIVMDSDIDLQTSGELQINGVPGITDNTLCLTDPSNGDLYTATFTKGLLTSLVAV